MADFLSLNEFMDRTSSAKIDEHIETIKAGISRSYAARTMAPMSMMEHSKAVKRFKSGELEAEFSQMKTFVLKRYEKAKATHTFLDAGGNFVDCIGFEQQQTLVTARAKGHKVLKRCPEPSIIEVKQAKPKRGLRKVEPITPPLSSGAFDAFGNAIMCPEGTIPLRRITISQMARHGRFVRFFEKSPGKSFPLAQAGAMPTIDTGPDGYVHRHAIAQASVSGPVNYFGCTSYLNLWGEDPSPGDMHLSQTWIVGTDPSGASAYPDTVESGWQVSPSAWGTKLPILFIFFNPDGYGTRSPDGQSRSGYGINQFHEGFISFPTTTWIADSAAGGFSTLSTPGGPQKGFAMQWQRDANGNWLLYCGTATDSLVGVGYFPSNLYQNTFLGQSASLIQFGGEVASKNPQGSGPMGSGVAPSSPATSGFGTVAFQKQISVQTAIGAAMTSPPLLASTDSSGYYESVVGSSNDPSWGSFFYYGGASGPL
jgi:hypothetical protein